MLAPKSIALLIAGVVIISAVFSVFQVTYPTGNPITKLKVPQQFQLFQYQFVDKNLLGNSSTNFVPSANGTITIEGYVHNASSLNDSPIGNAYLYAAVFPAESNFLTHANGFYKITVVKYGHGTFAFQVPGYNPELVKLSLYGSNVYWLNLSLKSAQKYIVSGTVFDQSGHTIPGAKLSFSDFIQTFNVAASKAGEYSISLFNGTYGIVSETPGYSSITNPEVVIVSGSGQTNFNITLKALSKPAYYVSGYVSNVEGKPIHGAQVSSTQISNYSVTNSSGYYRIDVPAGPNVIIAFATGYGQNFTSLFVTQNMTDINITLTNKNPFGNSGNNSINGTGISGLPPGAVRNITKTIGNQTSTVNYGNNTTSGSKSGILLQGNVTNPINGARVVDTYIYFYVNVNGTYYYNGVMTNGTGHYSLVVSHPGHYYFYVYNPMYQNYSFSMWINATSYHNFTLTPEPAYMHIVSGNVTNALDGQGIPSMVTVFAYGSVTNPILRFVSNSTGFYTGSLVQGNYSLMASSYGFINGWNNSSVHPLLKNEIINFSLAPVTTLGKSTNIWNNNSQTGIPGVSSTNVSSQLNNSTGGSTLATGTAPINLTIKMENATDNSALKYMQYDLFLKLNNLIYAHNGTTNSTGKTVVPLGYEGNYSLLVESVYYYSSVVMLNITGNMSITMHLIPRPVFSMSVLLQNSYNLTHSGNIPIPISFLNITNYKQSLNRTSAQEINGTGTMIKYSVPDGNYSFTYNNANYVSHSFYTNISDSANSTIQKIKPYLVIVQSDTSAQFTYELSGLTPGYLNVPQNAHSYTEFFAGMQKVTYTFQANLGGNIIYPTSFSLTQVSPVTIINLSINASQAVTPTVNFNQNLQKSGTLESFVYYSLTASKGYIYRMSVNYSIGHNPYIDLNGNNLTSAGQSGNMFNLSSYYNYTGATSNVTVTSYYDGFNSYMSALPGIYNSSLTVYYYVPSFSYRTSGGT